MNDHDAIRYTIAAYCHRCDDGRFDDFADLFMPDAVFAVMGGEHVGRDAIKAFMESAQPPERRGKHVTANSVIDVDGDRARVATDYVFVTKAGDGYAMTSVGRYLDEMVRDGAVWRFARREIVFL